MSEQSTLRVSKDLADAILALYTALFREFPNGDFAYTILGTGQIIAASNAKHGNICARTEGKKIERKRKTRKE